MVVPDGTTTLGSFIAKAGSLTDLNSAETLLTVDEALTNEAGVPSNLHCRNCCHY